MGIPLYICWFSLVAFNFLSLSLIFVSLIAVCLGVSFLGFILPGTLCFLDLVDYLLSHVREVFGCYFLKYFLRSFLSFFWDPYNVNLGTFNVGLRSLSGCLHFFFFSFFFSIFCSAAVISTILSSKSLIHSSVSVILLLIPSSVLFISVCSLGLW